jgi:prevent-host-death family protein
VTKRTTRKKSRLTYGVREAKARLSELLEEARLGTEVFITDRGRPIGKLVALEPGDLSLEDRFTRLTQKRLIEAPGDRPRSPLPEPVPLVGYLAQEFLQADRDS